MISCLAAYLSCHAMIHMHYLFNNWHPDNLLIYFPQDFLYKKNSMKFIKQKIDRLIIFLLIFYLN